MRNRRCRSERFPTEDLRASPGTVVPGAALAASLAGAPASAAESRCFALDDCRTIDSYEEGGGGRFLCAGPGGDFGTFSAFNTAKGPVEWRIGDNGQPFAAILRYSVADGGTAPDAPVVYRIEAGSASCAVAVIDGGTNDQANGVARGQAAAAPRPDCAEKAILVAARGSAAATFNDPAPEGSH